MLSSFNSPSCHSARRACPKLQNPHFKTRKITFSLGKVLHQGGWGVEESALPRPSPIVCDGPPLSEGMGYFFDDGFCDVAFCLAQNEGGGGILWRMKVFGLENPTERKSVAISMDFLMMDCVLVRIVNMWIDYGLMLIGFWLIHVFDYGQRQFILWSL